MFSMGLMAEHIVEARKKFNTPEQVRSEIQESKPKGERLMALEAVEKELKRDERLHGKRKV